MKTRLSYLAILFSLSTYTYAQQADNSAKPEFKIVTIVESINFRGNGESRIIDSQTEVDDSEYAAFKTDGSKAKNRALEGRHIKVDKLEEIKLRNLFDGFEVSPKNVAFNDAMTSSKINSMVKEGWNLIYVTSAIESDAGDGDLTGMLITRLFFSK
ncbi:hypothetical protein [uncultured Algoriphagus sp.]|uniref:hypothetical protein n=1 Tax=uncultured Algoriphagus sp. TaxID=417365 RepID=UPI0030ECF67A|tara:strand:+ start:8183 stop:8650 length:468 start_codon:yes stop_codon:yes gene_type:complete